MMSRKANSSECNNITQLNKPAAFCLTLMLIVGLILGSMGMADQVYAGSSSTAVYLNIQAATEDIDFEIKIDGAQNLVVGHAEGDLVIEIRCRNATHTLSGARSLMADSGSEILLTVANIKDVLMDSKTIGSSDHSRVNDPLRVIIKKAYINTLAVGKHTVKITFQGSVLDGKSAEVSFDVLAQGKDNDPGDNKDKNKDKDKNKGDSKDKGKDSGADSNNSNGKTGATSKTIDNMNIYFYVILIGLILALTATIIAVKRKNKVKS